MKMVQPHSKGFLSTLSNEVTRCGFTPLFYFGVSPQHDSRTFWLLPGQPPGHEGKFPLGQSTDQGGKTLLERPTEFMGRF